MAGPFTVAIKGGALSGESRGEGPPLVLVHGMAGERSDWSALSSALSATRTPDWRQIAYDLRGFGGSEAQAGIAFSHADDLLSLLDHLDLARAALVGVSMGGGIALNFALDHPERLSQLTLISPAMVGWEWSDEWKALWRRVAEAARAGDLPLARQRWFHHPMFAVAREDPAIAAELRRSIERYHGRQWLGDDQRDELPDIERLHSLAVPTLLLTGERDVTDMLLIADVIAVAAPGVTRIDFAGAGHMLHQERPTEVARTIAAHAIGSCGR